jgi:hypothetical protein
MRACCAEALSLLAAEAYGATVDGEQTPLSRLFPTRAAQVASPGRVYHYVLILI